MEVDKSKDIKIAAFGEWNTTNLGDRAICQGVTEFFQKAGYSVDAYNFGTLKPVQNPIHLLSSHEKSGEVYFPKEMNYKTPYSSFKNISSPSNFYSLKIELTKILKRGLRPIIQRIRIQKLIPKLKNAQVIMVGGGALLSDTDLHFPQSLSTIMWASKKLQIPLICLGCSAETEWSKQGEKIITAFAKSCYFIATRDHNTANRLSQRLGTQVPVFGDFALLAIKPRQLMPHTSNQQILAVNVMAYKKHVSHYQSRYDDVLCKIINAWLDKHSGNNQSCVKLFTTGNSGDIKRAKIILSQLSTSSSSLHVCTNVEQLRTLMRSSTAVLATRLHSAILALAEGVPVLGLFVGPKIENFFSTLGISKHTVSVLNEQVVLQVLKILEDDEFKRQSELINLFEMEKIRSQVIALVKNLAALTN
ncbi:MAG: polysaccharide pyruvyl transferase family protein [Trichormus sp. ATA11-4-KO1]|jgi:polysaccharide pyruvyl transferase WcaK-like protein|nr:polysaccharide pyruvyl transferase family protein [Trichormus sp. ATA11-4-KO1]